MSAPSTVGVVGAGTMGAAIAYVAAAAGHRVIVVDRDRERLEALPGRFRASHRMQRLVAGRVPAADPDRLAASVTTSVDVGAVAEAGLVVENVTEDLGAKAEVYGRLGALCPAPAVLAANTSAIPIDWLAARTAHPERVLGMHFMNPAELKPAVEVVRGPRTDAATLEAGLAFLGSLGKEPIVVGDGPGFVSNRLLMALVNDAAAALADGVAGADEIDRVMTACLGHPMGPLATA
ncbi:MAG TPA: 3-hydroxyacyl-CoA dehydrogenase family protein, partial [Candidatus Dormibacteraeota bacterium]|nr:3-hydroxyacyl-CoA dehydrogenase family protein [Candidatus Dormibacteraeota bacterium]